MSTYCSNSESSTFTFDLVVPNPVPVMVKTLSLQAVSVTLGVKVSFQLNKQFGLAEHVASSVRFTTTATSALESIKSPVSGFTVLVLGVMHVIEVEVICPFTTQSL